ncbi:MAG: hypothetical protein DMG69_29450 [Acidobacteria bacterium]|nr:MAG: hypothetical protein DMG69_29450 [Acidobacteriota bacterium]
MARIGTKKHPAVVRVATEERARQILDLCNQHGIQVIVGIESDQPEDISEVERILRRPEPLKVVAKAPRRVTGNDYCPCGSGQKYKKGCAARVPATSWNLGLPGLGARLAHHAAKWPISRAPL